MKIVHSTPSSTKPSIYAVSKEDRTFTLSPQAYAIVQHHAEHADVDLDTALSAIILTLDAMLMTNGLNKATATVNEDNTTTYSFSPESVAIKNESLKVIK